METWVDALLAFGWLMVGFMALYCVWAARFLLRERHGDGERRHGLPGRRASDRRG